MDSDSEYEESPPWFKYKRLNGLPSRLFTSDPVSTSHITTNSNTLLIGTHSGILVIVDSITFEVKTMFKAHQASILCIDSDDTHFMTASIDGTINVGSFDVVNDLTKFDFKRPLHAVAIHKPYIKTKAFFSGGTAGEVVYSTRNWLGARQDTVIESNGGCVTLIKEQDGLLLWCNDTGIRIAQINTRKTLVHLPTPQGIGRPELHWPKVRMDKFSVLVGWLDTVWRLKIEGGNGSTINGNSRASVLSGAASSLIHVEEKSVDIMYRERVSDCLIAGLVEYNDDLVILNYIPKVGARSFPPELKVLDGVSFDEVSIEELMLNGYEGLGMNDFELLPDCNSELQRWFLISAHDGIIVEPYTIRDKIDWLVEKERFLEAWEMSGHVCEEEERIEIGKQQMEQWIDEGDVEQAVGFVSRWLGLRNAELWNEWIVKLGTSQCVDILPVEYIGINRKLYDEILHGFLERKEYKELKKYTELWDHEVFDVKDLQMLLIDDGINDETRELFIELSLEIDEPEVCVPQMMILQDTKIMEFLDQHHLLTNFIDSLPEIIMIGVKEPLDDAILKTNIEILTENIHELVPSTILSTFKTFGVVRYLYLKELGRVDPVLVRDFEDEIIELYAEYDSVDLGKFIRKHTRYNIDRAIQVCEEHECSTELVYLLSKIGENEKALRIIIDDIKDPKMAIAFVQRVNEQDLWDYLLDYSMKSSEFIEEILKNVDELADPIPIVSRIPCGVEINGLRNVVMDITRNSEMDVRLHEIINGMLGDEFMKRMNELRDLKSAGYVVDNEELEMVQREYEATYIRYEGVLRKEIDAIGVTWGGDRKNQMVHKSFIKLKLREKKSKRLEES